MKVGFISLGCPKNLVDSEVMMGQLTARGHELTTHPDQAEVLVVNTCSFIDPAKKESIDTILEMAREVAGQGVDAIAIVCTNMRAGPIAERIEAERGGARSALSW